LRVAAKKKCKISECGLEGRCFQRREPASGSPPEIEDELEDDYRETIEERGESSERK